MAYKTTITYNGNVISTFTGENEIDLVTANKFLSGNVNIKVEEETPSILYLYNEGDECTSVTGGWVANRYATSAESYCSHSQAKNSDNLYCYVKNNIMTFDNIEYATTNSIPFSEYTTLYVRLKAEFVSTGTYTSDNDRTFVAIYGSSGWSNENFLYYKPHGTQSWTKTEEGTLSVPCSELIDGRLLVGVCTGYTQNLGGYFYQIWLE